MIALSSPSRQMAEYWRNLPRFSAWSEDSGSIGKFSVTPHTRDTRPLHRLPFLPPTPPSLNNRSVSSPLRFSIMAISILELERETAFPPSSPLLSLKLRNAKAQPGFVPRPFGWVFRRALWLILKLLQVPCFIEMRAELLKNMKWVF